jgi:DNA-directed RNA polymerase
MTTVYGVTQYGARLQILGELKDLGSFPDEHIIAARNYLTEKTLSSLEQMFTSARQIQVGGILKLVSFWFK